MKKYNRLFYPILIAVFLSHGLYLNSVVKLSPYNMYFNEKEEKIKIKIVSLKNLGLETEKHESLLATKSLDRQSNKIRKKAYSKNAIQTSNVSATVLGGREYVEVKRLKDITLDNIGLDQTKALKKITLKGHDILEFGSNQKSHFDMQNEFAGLDMQKVDIHVPPPRGISDTEFKDVEDMFYSFQRRIATKYINTFILESRKFEDRNPQFIRSLKHGNKREEIVLHATITYDKNGDIEKISLKKNTKVQILQSFWEDILAKLDKFPNPPQAYQENGTFDVSFQLTIDVAAQ